MPKSTINGCFFFKASHAQELMEDKTMKPIQVANRWRQEFGGRRVGAQQAQKAVPRPDVRCRDLPDAVPQPGQFLRHPLGPQHFHYPEVMNHQILSHQ